VFLLEKNKRIKNKIRQKVQIMLNELSSIPSTNLLEDENIKTIDYFQLIYECVERHKIFLNFVDFKTRSQLEPDLDLAILQAILIGNKENGYFLNKTHLGTSGNDLSKNNMKKKQEQLHLAFEWNRVDIVKNFIMQNERDWKVTHQENHSDNRIILDPAGFIQLGLKNPLFN
jgi:hypothetical protein